MPASGMPLGWIPNLTELARIGDAFAAGGRRDLAAHVVEMLYYFAERENPPCGVLQFPAANRAVRPARA